MKLKLSLLLIISCSFSCSLLTNNKTKRVSFNRVIFSEPYKYPKNKRYFTPSETEVVKAEELIYENFSKLVNDSIISDFERSFIYYNNFKLYKRQYTGYYNRKNEKVIIIYFHKSRSLYHLLNWKKQIFYGGYSEKSSNNFGRLNINLLSKEVWF